MKPQSLFTGVILIGIGLYYFLSQSTIFVLFNGLYTWPTLLCIIGIAFLSQAYKAHIHDAILPGVILFGLGIHFHVVQHFNLWSNDIGVFLLIISLGLLLQAKKTKTGMFNGFLLLIISIYLLFQQEFFTITNTAGINIQQFLSFGPVLLMVIGALVLFIKK